MINAIARGDERAFEQLFREMYARLCVYAESLVRDHEQAEDLVQGVFCDLWEKREKLRIEVSLSAYLFRAVYHEALNVLKHERVKQEFARFVEEHGKRSENNVEEFFLQESRNEVLAEIKRAVDSLPEQCREIFSVEPVCGEKECRYCRFAEYIGEDGGNAVISGDEDFAGEVGALAQDGCVPVFVVAEIEGKEDSGKFFRRK